MSPLAFVPVPGFVDNYFWILHRDGKAVVVDPGDATPVLERLARLRLRLEAILITHHHPDHTGGINRILRDHALPVYGPRTESKTIPALTHLLDEGSRLAIPALGIEFEVWAVPGHTLGHIAYLGRSPGEAFVLCGDTLFKAGCGRLFEGTAAQLNQSLQRLARLPPQTAVYCTHEYSLANLRFAAAVEPANDDVTREIERVQALLQNGDSSLPSTIGLELLTNPFLRCDQPVVRSSAESFAGQALGDATSVFAALRLWKDRFRAA